MKKALHTAWALALMLLVSCETVVEIDLPEQESQLTLNGLFERDSTFLFTMSASKGVLEAGELEDITDGRVQIVGSDGTLEVIDSVSVHPETGQTGYRSTLRAKAGIAYTVTASHKDYPIVTAMTLMPNAVPVDRVDTATVFSIGTVEKQVLISFSDPAGEANFYEARLYLLLYFPDGADSIPYMQEIPAFAASGGDGVFSNNTRRLIFSDELFDGQNYAVRVAYNTDWLSGDTAQVVDQLPSYLVAELRTLSEDYYKFQVSYGTYQGTAGDPFAQPVQVYNNVDGGFGIVAGLNAAQDTMPFSR